MEIILLEKNSRLGNLGDKVKVKPGFGRNYLIPMGKALPATSANIDFFETQRAELEAAAAKKLDACKVRASTLDGLTVSIKVNASEEGRLFGSVGEQEIVLAVEAMGHELTKSEVQLQAPIRELGAYEVALLLSNEINIKIQLVITV